MSNCKVTFYPMDKEIEIPVGTPLKKAMDIAELDFDFPCGGRGRCGKCRVRIQKGVVPPSDSDFDHLDEEEIEAGFRLACIINVEDDLVVEIPLTGTEGHKILVDAAEREMQLKPHLSKIYRDVPHPSIEDQRPDWDRLRNALSDGKSERNYKISYSALKSSGIFFMVRRYSSSDIIVPLQTP